jgi:hypothetical protein
VRSARSEGSRPGGWAAWAVADAGRSRIEQEGFSATSLATMGSPHEQIARQARGGGFDLTLIGRGHSYGPAMIPTTASSVLSNSDSAILVSRARPRGEIQVLLVADDSAASQAALRCFGEFADPRRCRTTSVSVPDSTARVGSAHRHNARVSAVEVEPIDRSIELVRTGHFEVVVSGVGLEGGIITADPVVRALLQAAPTLLVAHT